MTMRKLFQALLASAMLLVALGAFGASTAAASTTEECKEPVAGEIFTSQHFLDANCEKANTEGEYHTVKVSGTAELIRTNTGPIVVQASIAGIETEVTCETLSGPKMAWNYIEGGVTGFKGEGKMKFSGCKVAKPVGCSVKQPIETVQLSESSEDLAAEVMRTLFVPVEGSKLATVTLEGCAISGSYALEGKLRSQTVSIHTEEFSASSGSEVTLAKKPVIIKFPFHDATLANGKTVVRETP